MIEIKLLPTLLNPFFPFYEVGEKIHIPMIVRHASTILPFSAFSKQSAGGIFSFCLNIDKGFLNCYHYHYHHQPLVFIIIIYTSSHFVALRGEIRGRDLKNTTPHTQTMPTTPRGIWIFGQAGWSVRTVLAETEWTGYWTGGEGEFVVVGGKHRDIWELRKHFALRRLGSAGGRMDGLGRSFHVYLYLSVALGNHGEREKHVGRVHGWWICFLLIFSSYFFQRNTD